MGFLGLGLGEVGDGVEGEERMKTPTPTRTWGGWGGILLGGFYWLLFLFLLRWGLGCLLVLGDGCCCCDIPAVFGSDS